MPKTLIHRALLAVMVIVSLLLVIDAVVGGPAQQLIIGLAGLATAVVLAPSLRRVEQKGEPPTAPFHGHVDCQVTSAAAGERHHRQLTYLTAKS